MKNTTDLEVIQITTKDGKLVATLSYRDLTTLHVLDDVNYGYRTIEVPVNLRDIQLSGKGKQLVNQSIKEKSILSNGVLKSISSIVKNVKVDDDTKWYQKRTRGWVVPFWYTDTPLYSKGAVDNGLDKLSNLVRKLRKKPPIK